MKYSRLSQISGALLLTVGALLMHRSAEAAVWTNFTGNLRWGTTVNWSPNTFPNADGAIADFQVDVPVATTIGVVANGGGNLTPLLTTLKLGDTSGTQGVTLNKGNPAATTSRLHFTNSSGSVLIEKNGTASDAIEVGSIRTYNTNLNVVFNSTGSLLIGCDISQQTPYVTRLNVSGPGSLILDANSVFTGGTVINGSTVVFGGDQRFGSAPVSVEPANITVGNNGTIRSSGNVVNLSINRGIMLKGGGNVYLATSAEGQTFNINGPISSDPSNPATLVASGPGNILFLGGPNSYTTDTILAAGTLTMIAANQTGGGSLVVSNSTMLTLNLTNSGSLNVANASLGNGGDVTLNLDYGTLAGANPASGAMNVAGSFNPGAANIILNVSGSGFVAGQFPLIDYSGSALPDISNFTLANLPPGVIGTLVHNTANTSIDLNISLVVNAVTWFGSLSDQWDIATTANWNGGTATYNEYGTPPNVNGDSALFDDTLDPGTLRTQVTLATAVRPAIVTVANNSYDYTLGGAGKITGSTVLNKSGTMALTINTANDYTGASTVSLGTVRLGHDTALGTGIITLSGGALSSDSATPRNLANTLRVTAASRLGDAVNSGTLTFADAVDFAGAGRDLSIDSEVIFSGTVGNGGLDQKWGTGVLRLNGVIGEFSNGQMQVERGSVIMSGGSIVKSGGGLRIVCTQAMEIAYFNLTGGGMITFTAGGSNMRLGSPSSPTSEPTATNVVDLAGTVTWTTNNTSGGFIQMGGSCALAQLNLKSGSLLRPFAFVHEGNVTEINFEGGTLAPLTSNPTFLQGLTAARIHSGGLIVDTEGKDITIGQALLDAGTGGGLTKNGAGKLTLTGANTYTGNTVVNGGTLVVSPAHVGTGDMIVNAGGVGGFSSPGIGQAVSVGSTTVASGGALQVEFSGYSANPTSPAASIGTLSLSGSVPINVRASGLTVGTIPLITYTTLTGGGSLTVGQLPQGVVGTVVHNVGAKTFELVISSITPLQWTGSVNSNWDLLTQNWTLSGTPILFSNGDPVRLDDSASSSSIIIPEPVSPGSVIISNTALAYTISTLSTGKLTGSFNLVKQGANVLTINGTHDFDGNITVAAGTLVANSTGALGSTNGITIVQSGATLDSTGKDLRNERITVSGIGHNGQGALISSSATQNSLRWINMEGDTVIGATNGIQWGFQSSTAVGATFLGNGFKITKVGSGDVLLKDLAETGIGDIEIVESALSFQQSTTMGDPTKTCTVQPNGVLAFWDTVSPLQKNVTMNSGGMKFNSGNNAFSGPITLNGTNRISGTATLNLTGTVSGSGHLAKLDSGVLVLSGANTYSGNTVVSNGTLQIGSTGSIASSAEVFVNTGATFDVSPVTGFTIGAGQKLAGSGTVNGSVAVSGTLAPGALIGTLSFGNDLTLNGVTLMEVTADGGLARDSVNVTGALTYGGTLQIVLAGSTPLSVNDTFDLFNWGTIAGSFSNVILPGGYSWDTTQLAVDGTIRVAAVAASPTIGTVTLSGNNLTMNGSGGAPGASYRVLASTNVALPVVNWTPVATNTFDGSGNFSFSTTVSSVPPQTFYLISAP